MNIHELNRQKAERKAAAEKLINAAMQSGHDLAGTELAEYEGHVARVREIESLVQRHNDLSGIEVAAAEPTAVINAEGVAVDDRRATAEYKKAFWATMRNGRENVSREILATLSVSADGNIVPVEYDRSLVEKLQNENVMRQLATIITTQNDRKIAVENAVASADWAAESAVAHNDDSSDEPTFSQVTLSAYKLSRIQKISEELLMDALFDLPSYLAKKFAQSFGIAEESAFVNGNGSGKPTGVVGSSTASVLAASATDITADEVITLFHGLKRAYRANASFLMNDSTALLLRLKKETTGQYIWQPGLVAGRPDTLLGKPVYISDAMPTAAINAKTVLFGDFSYYTIAERAPRTLVRLNELYAANGQVGFRSVERLDGKLTLAESVVRITQAAA
jgi:HK97 family phage major capsid protein